MHSVDEHAGAIIELLSHAPNNYNQAKAWKQNRGNRSKESLTPSP